MSEPVKKSTALSPYQEKVGTIRTMLESAKGQIKIALPRHLDADRMGRIVMTAAQKTPALLDCTPKSLIAAVIQAAQLGLEPDGVLGHAYLVPYSNKGVKEVQLIPGYKGLIDLARRSGQLSTIYARAVYARDSFHYQMGTDEKIEHVPTDEDEPGELVAVYAVAKLKDGGVQMEVMTRKQVDKIKTKSKASSFGPWVDHFDEMAKKTVLRRLCKMLPLSVEMARTVALDERADAGQAQEIDVGIDFAEADVVSESKGPTSLADLVKKPATGMHDPNAKPPEGA